MKIKPSIYISYAWGESESSEEEMVVNSLCDALAKLNYEVVRDRDYLKYLDNLPSFLKRIGSGGYVIAIVGAKYLHSENCMIEASYMAHKGNLKIRIFPIILSSLTEIFKIETRNNLTNDLLQYWQTKEAEIQKSLDDKNYPQGFISIRKDLSLLTQLINYLSEFINHLGTSLEITSQEHVDEKFKRLFEKINQSINADFKEIRELHGYETEGKNYYQRFSSDYIGRKENIEDVLKFLNDPEQHFMLLFGVGGMGKSHLIDICRKSYNQPFLLHEECTSNYNLKSLFKTCRIDYPGFLETTEDRQRYFLDEFCRQNTYLILDDFYETTDYEIRSMLPKIVSIPSGKILLVSRAIPKELENLGFHFEKYSIPALDETDFNEVIQNYIISEKKAIVLTPFELKNIFNKAQGYPLGGQLIIDLLFLGEKLDDILTDLPKFEAELDEEGKKFSGRLLDNIFLKGNKNEISLLCQFSALFGASPKELIRQLPAFNQNAFDALVNRRRFIWKDENDLFNSHAMIKDYAYNKLIDKPIIHNKIGKYFENKLFDSPTLDSSCLESAILHYKRVGIVELQKFGQRVDKKFNINDVKSLIEDNVRDTIRNYKSLLEVYPEKLAYYNELGIAYRLNNQKQIAIKTFLKAIGIDSRQLPAYNELGITYRENNQKQLAIETFLEAENIDPTNVRILNELGITYRENNQRQLAIETFLRAEIVEPTNVRILNELGITYRESNQKQLAIETLLKAENIESANVRILNELGITYRESNQYEQAIKICEKALNINSKHAPSVLNLLQIYIFFMSNKDKAIEFFNRLNHPPYHSSFRDNRKPYKLLIDNLHEICDLTLDDFKIYDKFMFFSIQYKAYQTILPLLFKLNEKYPNNSKIISRLGKTLSNQVIALHEDGWVFLKQAIDLFMIENNREQYEGHLYYYFYNLLNNDKLEKLQEELESYKQNIQGKSKYYRFIAKYYEALKKSDEEITAEYETALTISDIDEEKLITTETYLEYVTRIDKIKYHSKIENLKKMRNELYNIINQSRRRPSH